MKPEILIAKIKHSTNAIILVEGRADMQIYRKIEKYLELQNVSFFPCEGRENLLKIYERRHELTHTKVIFIADKDMYAFKGVPQEYNEIIFTKGYCIENDLYIDGKKYLDNLLFSNEIAFKKLLVENIIKWFACEIDKALNGNLASNQFSNVSILSEKICDKKSSRLKETFFQTDSIFTEAQLNLIDKISENYPFLLRGKFIFQIYLKIFRDFREGKDEVTYTDAQLFDMCFHIGKETTNSCIAHLIREIKQIYAKK